MSADVPKLLFVASVRCVPHCVAVGVIADRPPTARPLLGRISCTAVWALPATVGPSVGDWQRLAQNVGDVGGNVGHGATFDTFDNATR